MLVFKNAKVFCENGFNDKILIVEDTKITKVFSPQEFQTFQQSKGLQNDYMSQDSINNVKMHQNTIEKSQSHISQYREIDCRGKTIIPSCIDINIFPLDKRMNAKTIHTLVKKALKGGVSTFFLNPYTQPNIDNEAMNALIQSIDNHEKVNVFPLIPSIDASGHLSNIDILQELNPKARAIFSNSSIGSNYLYQTMQYAKMLNLPLCIFAYDFNMEQGVAYESMFARGLGLPMMTPIGQIKEVAKIKEMAKFLDLEVILMSMNIAYCFDMVCHEKNIHTQVGLPHLVFSEQSIRYYDTRYKIIPPLLTRSKQDKLIKRLREGKVSLLTSMQNAVSKEFQEQVFEFAPSSVEGLEYFFSLAYTRLVKENIISLENLIKITSSNASNFMQLNKGRIEVGRDADFMIIDLEESFRINNPLSIYHDMEVYGKIKNMIIGGDICEVE
ncbi:dihydroorotase [Helicobacter didelphidarum]|uniref:Dihydroorotase n=1 Tax=Helicobacter didelphidarum TaxID=2040648 RepID=A0A3D8IR93_9HELI|nr:amidohydrolase family protein [Helicobacter didelphidarum]RDU67500.1 dihydroorotase [Helicobacter didelphidarum]